MLGKLRNLVRELGLGGTACYVVYRLCAKSGGLAALHRYLFVAQPVPEAPLLPSRRGKSIVVRELDPEDSMLLSLPLQGRVLRYRASQGAVCLGAFQRDEIIGCLWLCLTPYEEDEVRCRYHPGPPGRASWDFDVYLKPEHRSGLGFARLWDSANAFLRGRGVIVSWSRISAFNATSLASHARLGAKIMGSATFVRLGTLQMMVATLAPYIHLSLRPSQIPDLRLSAESEPAMRAYRERRGPTSTTETPS